ncbi:MAG: DUF4845 domain-containing protein [Pseudomonadota bacterium]
MKNQAGRVNLLTLMGVVALCVLVVVGMKVAPSYLNYWYIQAAVESVHASPPRSSDTDADVYRRLERHMQDNAVYGIEPEEVVTITGRGPKRRIFVDYEVKIPLFFNASLVFNFGENADSEPG